MHRYQIPCRRTSRRETVYTYNLGLDLSFLQNHLSFTGDFFIRDTKDMLTQSDAAFGLRRGDADRELRRPAQGWEALSITWRDQFKAGRQNPFTTPLTGQIGDYQTEITKYNNPTEALRQLLRGKKLGEIWGYHVPKLFTTPTRRPPPTRWRSTTVRTRLPARLQHAEQPGQADGRRRDVRGPRRQRLDRHGRGDGRRSGRRA